MNIDEMPVWPGHPWGHVVGQALQVRRSKDDTAACIVTATGLHADFRLSPLPSDTDVAMMAMWLGVQPLNVAPIHKSGMASDLMKNRGYPSPWPEFNNAS